VSVTAWRGIFGPKGLSAAQTGFWDDVFSKLVETAEWKKQLEENDLTSQYLGSREFSKYLEREHAATRAVMTDLGILK
jgi:putative tricarboxylic transport membrane protein